MKKRILTRKEVLHLANLVKLTLTEDEIIKYQKQMRETLNYIENLKEINTDKVSIDFSTNKAKNIFFKDGVSNKRILSSKSNYFVVKRIL
jgi:aspartyl-tRNA(Asn)/glutamyl-tRNA(Gln) amidotransferase subunit C